MGMLDAKLQFSSAQAVTATAASTFFYDQLTGEHGHHDVHQGAERHLVARATYFGEDLGIGKGPGTPRIIVSDDRGVC